MMARSAAATFLVVAAVSLTVVAVMRVGDGRVELFEFDAQRDPIMSPLFLGANAEQNAVRELARITGPLQGAFSPASQTQLYQNLRGLTTGGPGGGRFVVGPGGQEYEVEALPLSRRQGMADGFEPVGDDKYDDALTQQALESYREDQRLPAADESAFRQQEEIGKQPYAPSYVSGDFDDDDLTRHALESYRQELAAPLPAEVEQGGPAVLDDHALPVEEGGRGRSHHRERGIARRQASLGKIERLFQQLQNPRDRAAAAVLVREDETAEQLRSAVGRELPLQHLEGRVAKELRITALKIRDAHKVKQLGQQELGRYHNAVQKGERLEASDVHYLKAAHNYALEARRDVLHAQTRDVAAERVLAGAPAVLGAAHKAEVKARLMDNAAGLRRAGSVINKELSQVEAARVGEAAAAKQRADAKENAFVSRVINRVRQERFGGAYPSVKALAQQGAKAHEDISEATKELAINSANHIRADKWLTRAKFQDQVRTVTSDVHADALKAVGALHAAEAAGRDIDGAAQALRRDTAKASIEEQAAKQRELAAASMHA